MKKWIALMLGAMLSAGCSDDAAEQPENGQPAVMQDEKGEVTGDAASPAVQEEKPQDTQENSSESFIEAEVVKVIDGDTVKVMTEGREETLRLLLVDTPETVHPNKPVQPFGPEASRFAKDTLSGKKVELELDVGERDKYGRLLVYLHVDGKMFNEMLIEKGFARVGYVYAPNTKHVDRFYELQKQAQQSEIGIWSIENYAAEDEGFRELQEKEEAPAESKDESCSIKGNISSSGEKIYHLPEGQYYDVTKEEALFCSEKEAVQAGYRASKR
ncbi:thermonuclease family protein [Metabacillus indicus]|uniref:thermonuclease family protein n=1 Tax=Metabacillus indicus TaxID=246786 RepID=UPI003CF3828D